jgi:UDP-glucose-4-epimerase GalE
MRILITGGAGYIGSHTAKAVAAQGWEPVVVDNLSNGHRWAVRWGPFYLADLQDKERLDAVIRKTRPDAVIHFAASAYVGESVVDPAKYFRNNVVSTVNLLECLVRHDVNNLVLSSSCAVYGIPPTLPITEDSDKKPLNPYGESKLAIERMLPWYGSAYGLRWVALRYFNAAGADPEGDIGECHLPETHLVPLVIDAALGRREHVDVFGTDYSTPDGTAIRDYVHVSDLAEAHVLAVRHLLRRQCGCDLRINLGTGSGYSVRDIMRAVTNISGYSVPARFAERRIGDPSYLIADPSKARAVLGWTPMHSDLETIINSALRWHTSHSHETDRSRVSSLANRIRNADTSTGQLHRAIPLA